MKHLLFAGAAALATLAAPASAATVDLSQSGNWTNQPGYFTTSQSFLLPTNARDVKLTISFFDVDDRGVLSLNGTAVDATGIFAGNGTTGSFNFGQNAPTVSYFFNPQYVRNTVVTTGFVLGGANTFTFEGNDTNNGIYGDVLGTAANASYGFSANISYTAGVPEPAAWGLMILGFGAVGGALRQRRRATVRFAAA